jgi:corrinoid protein of di/trimethylamine methyltransferase
MNDFDRLHDAILNGDAKTATALTEEALAAKIDPQELIQRYMVPAMDEVGRRFECEEYFVPELLLSARAMKSALALLRPLLVERGAKPAGRVLIGTVKGDLHDIGKNLVASLLEGGGFEVIDLGADVSPEAFVNAVREKKPHLVGLSALLTVTMPSMGLTIEALEKAGLRDQVKVLIGGAPVTPEFAKEIRADGYAENASVAVSLARRLVAS